MDRNEMLRAARQLAEETVVEFGANDGRQRFLTEADEKYESQLGAREIVQVWEAVTGTLPAKHASKFLG